VFDWVVKIETWVSLMVIAIIADFIMAWAVRKQN